LTDYTELSAEVPTEMSRDSTQWCSPEGAKLQRLLDLRFHGDAVRRSDVVSKRQGLLVVYVISQFCCTMIYYCACQFRIR